MYEYTNRGRNSVIFIFVSLCYWGQLLMERICSLGANSFLEEQTSSWMGFVLQGGNCKEKVKKLSPFVKVGKTFRCTQNTLKWTGIDCIMTGEDMIG